MHDLVVRDLELLKQRVNLLNAVGDRHQRTRLTRPLGPGTRQ